MTSSGMEFAGHELSRASLDACVKCTICETPVSYTHLDVYKRQGRHSTA